MKPNLILKQNIFEFIKKNQGCNYTEIVENFRIKHSEKAIAKYIELLKLEHIVIINRRYYPIPDDQLENYKNGLVHIWLNRKKN